MLIEQPIKNTDEDEFEREAFTSHIADILVLPELSPSLVISLEGEWGKGKTSTINLIQEKIKKNYKDALLINFNPWLIGSLDSVIEGFLLQLASSINRKVYDVGDVASKASEKLLNFAKFLSPIKLIPGVEPWGTLVESTLSAVGRSAEAYVSMSELDIMERKITVQEEIRKLGKPIVVIIDDVDRLPPNEIRIIFQLVKAIADFDRVSYLLAYDIEPIKKVLSYNEIYDGEKYLEKIVQLTYPLPRIGYWHLKEFLKKYLFSFIVEISLELDENGKNLLNELLDTTAVVRILSTPRDVIRLINRLKVTCVNIKNEVCFADVVAFESLEIKYPSIARQIRKVPESFLNMASIEGAEISQDYIDDMIKSVRDDHVEEESYAVEFAPEHDKRTKKNIDSILKFMFENTEGYSAAYVHNRISTKEALLRLLQSGPTKFNYSSEETKHFFYDYKDREQLLKDKFQSGNLYGWLTYAMQFISTFEKINDPEDILNQMLLLSVNAYDETGNDLTFELSNFIFELIMSISEEREKEHLLSVLVNFNKAFLLTGEVLFDILKELGLWQNNEYLGYVPNDISHIHHRIDPHKVIETVDKWIKNINESTSNYCLVTQEPNPVKLLFMWGHFNKDFSVVQNYIEALIGNQKTFTNFLDFFHEGKSLNGIEKLFKNKEIVVEAIEKMDNPSSSAQKVMNYLAVHSG